MHAGYRTTRSAALLREKFAVALLVGILRQRLAGVASLLRAVMHQAVLADVEIARAGAAAPVVLFAVGDIVLKAVDAGIAALLHSAHGQVHFALVAAQRLQLAVAIVNDADRGGEAELER